MPLFSAAVQSGANKQIHNKCKRNEMKILFIIQWSPRPFRYYCQAIWLNSIENNLLPNILQSHFISLSSLMIISLLPKFRVHVHFHLCSINRTTDGFVQTRQIVGILGKSTLTFAYTRLSFSASLTVTVYSSIKTSSKSQLKQRDRRRRDKTNQRTVQQLRVNDAVREWAMPSVQYVILFHFFFCGLPTKK